MSLKKYSLINSFFHNKKHDSFFQDFFDAYSNIDILNKNKEKAIDDLNDFFNKHNKSIDALPYIKATINQFLENRLFGNKKLVSLENLLRNMYLNMDFLLKNEGHLYRYMSPYISQVKTHIFLWHYYANRTDYETYKNAKIVIQAGFFNDKNPFLFVLEPFEKYSFNKIDIKRKDIDKFDGKWQMNNEWMYVKKIINKYFYKVRNITKEQKIKKIYKTPIGDFFEGIDEKIFFYGKEKDFLRTFKKD